MLDKILLKKELTNGSSSDSFCNKLTTEEYQNIIERMYCFYFINDKKLTWEDLIKGFNHNQRVLIENSFILGTYEKVEEKEYYFLRLSDKKILHLTKEGKFDKVGDLEYLSKAYGIDSSNANIWTLAEVTNYDPAIMKVINDVANNSVVRERIFALVIEKLMMSNGIKESDPFNRTKSFVYDLQDKMKPSVKYNIDKIKEKYPTKTKKRDLADWGYPRH